MSITNGCGAIGSAPLLCAACKHKHAVNCLRHSHQHRQVNVGGHRCRGARPNGRPCWSAREDKTRRPTSLHTGIGACGDDLDV
jgi:hypothetical protein